MKLKFLSHRRTIFSKILFPVMIIIIIQTIFYTLLLFKGGLIENIIKNSYDIFQERTVNRAIYMETTLTHNYPSLLEAEQKILNKMSLVLAQENKTYQDLKMDTDLNKKLITETAKEIISILRNTGATGAFLVLDGIAVQDTTINSRAGFYVRDLDPSSYSGDNSDLLLERGSSSIAKSLNIALDSYWESYFTFSNETENAAESFFFQPFLAAKKTITEGDHIEESSNYGYWSKLFALSEFDGNVITYSIPLVTENGEVIGVFGIDLSERYLLSMIKPEKQTDENSLSAYLLGIMTDENSLHAVCTNGSLFTSELKMEEKDISYTKNKDYEIYNFTSKYDSVVGSIQNLSLYNKNTPFEHEQWVLVSLVKEKDILDFPNKMKTLTYILSFFSILLGIVGVTIASHLLSSPVAKLATKVRNSSTNDYIKLDRININEIDELTTAIEFLNDKVMESKTKVSRIIEMLNLPIGVFEYEYGSDVVFCSKNLYKILGWSYGQQNDNYMPKKEFDEKMKPFADFLGGTKTFCSKDSEGNPCWIQLTSQDYGKQFFVAVMDITKDMLEKQKILYERDYDLLTDIHNRRAFVQDIADLFRLEKDQMKYAVMIMWDLDNLKYINDTFGHDIGDLYIKEFSNCIKLFLNYQAFVARRSGDEFFSFIYGYETKKEIMDIVNDIWDRILASSIQLPGGSFIKVRVSGGIAWYPDDSTDYEELFRYSDFAMYTAKHSTKGCVKEFDKAGYLSNAILLNGQEALNQILENELLHFAMQPIIQVSSGKVYGYEMLMRSQLAELASPMDVLRIARSQSKLYLLERLTFFKAMEQFVENIKLQTIGKEEKVFINSIASTCMNEEEVLAFSKKYHVYLDRIVVELTEEDELDLKCRDSKMEVINLWNAKYAIDDFGAGYNSEAVLLELSPDIIKIDISIIRNIDTDIKRQQMYQSIVKLARRYNIEILAEGVETKSEMETIVSLGADYIQGYYVARPDILIQPIPDHVVSEILNAYRMKKR